MDAKGLEEKAKVIRKHILESTCAAGSGHPGGSLSATEIVTVLYFHEMRHDPKNPKWEERDRFVLSKGHAAPLLYAALAESGYFPVETLKTLRKIDSNLQGHPDMKSVPGVEASTGSLGQGLSIAVGMALGLKLQGKDSRVFCLIGDGESQEGQIWEAAMAASHYKLDNLTVFLDRNGLQIDGFTEKVMALEPLAEKWRSFGWDVQKINGNSITEVMNALKHKSDKPKIIIALTTKGKGVSFMENVPEWHGKAPDQKQLMEALEELK